MADTITLYNTGPDGKEQATTVPAETARLLVQQSPGVYQVDPTATVTIRGEGGAETAISTVDYFNQYGNTARGMGPTTYAPEEVQERQESQQYGSTGSQVATGAESFAAGLTLGGSRPVLNYLAGPEYKEAAEKRAQHNPGVAVGGEIAGMLAPAIAAEILSGGTATPVIGAQAAATLSRGARVAQILRATPAGAVSTLGRAVESGLAARGVGAALRTAAAGTVEGTVQQAAAAIANEIGSGHDLSKAAENVLSSAAYGGLGGGIIGGVLGGVQQAGGAALRGIGRGIAKESTHAIPDVPLARPTAQSLSGSSKVPGIASAIADAFPEGGGTPNLAAARQLNKRIADLIDERIITKADPEYGALSALRTELDGAITQGATELDDVLRSTSKMAQNTEHFKQEQFLKSLGADKSVVARIAQGADLDTKVSQLIDDIDTIKGADGKPVYQIGATAEEMLPRFSAAKEPLGKQIGAAIDDVSAKMSPVDQARLRADLDDFFGNIASEAKRIDDLGIDASGVGGAAKIFRKLQDSLADKPVTVKDLWTFRKELDQLMTKKGVIDVLDPRRPALLQGRHALEEIVTKNTQRVIDTNTDLAAKYGSYRQIKSKYSSLSLAEQILEHGRNKSMGNQYFSLGDQFAGGMSGTVSGLGQMARGNVSGAIGAVAGPVAGPEAGLLAGAAGALLSGGDPISLALMAAGNIGGKAINRWYRTRGSSYIYGALQNAGKIDFNPLKGISSGMKQGAIQASAQIMPLSKRKSQTDAEAYHQHVIDLMTRKNDLREVLMSDDITPLEREVLQKQYDAINWLQKYFPVKPNDITDPLNPKTKMEPSPVALKRYYDMAQIVDDPTSVIKLFQENQLTANHMLALRQNYPEIYGQVQQAAVQYRKTAKEIPQDKRLQYSILTEEPATYGQAHIAHIQQIWSMPSEQQQQQISGKLPNNKLPFGLA